jgi:hypothetical protein
MATSEQEQKSMLVPQHKRLAQGAPVNTMPGKEPAKAPSSGLSHLKPKK